MADAAAEMTHHFLFEDSFTVKSVDNSRFERAGRLDCESSTFANNLEVDINNILWPVSPGDQINVAITSDVSPTDNPRRLATAHDHDPRLLGRSIMDQYEYVMYGKVYKKDVKAKDKEALVWASFGGLLMKLKSDEQQLAEFHVNDSIYLLMRKVRGADGEAWR
uniref:DNA-directed RNA polymerases I, II, and III subunit RPABC3 n=1 Tax=Alexandrium andersonii TaxID=327968 RepID=A0A7S2D485_9DINO|mmetsp:Transcript_47160/g.107029  ORF Transcript_47160/g.107029 Transcript_47160/m.107029 type:complete len:164 (+) Transcript_47160:140-631(+)